MKKDIIEAAIIFSCIIKTIVFLSNKIGHAFFDSIQFLKESIQGNISKLRSLEDQKSKSIENESEFV